MSTPTPPIIRISCDVFTQHGDHFYGTLNFDHDRLFGNIMEELSAALFAKYPTLKHRDDINVIFDA